MESLQRTSGRKHVGQRKDDSHRKIQQKPDEIQSETSAIVAKSYNLWAHRDDAVKWGQTLRR